MKILKWLDNNIFFVITLFLLAFIPLYPKIPLINIRHTWVYIRGEDFVVALALFIWVIQLIRGKLNLKTPLTIPIMAFWIIGTIATIHAILIIFPVSANVFSNVAFLSTLRRIEYLSLFFIAYSGMKNKRFMPYIIATLVITLLLVVGYGIGQRYFGFNAYLTMNEEFAKGIPIKLSRLSRVPSTFGGHYDLAAYLVLIIPILTSLIFGIKNLFVRLSLALSVALGFVLLFMTVSRVSFFVVLIALMVVAFFNRKTLLSLQGKRKLIHKKALFIFLTVPVVAFIFIFLSSRFSQGLAARFGNTVKEVEVLVDAKTGAEIGHVKRIKKENFRDKIIIRRDYRGRNDLTIRDRDLVAATSSAMVSLTVIPEEVIEVVPADTPTGENLPQGTGYINLTLSPVNQRVGEFYYSKPDSPNKPSTHVARFFGDFLIKKAAAYDLSFTTRFQGEWPNAIKAFKKNILFGSGYSSISLAVDNNFLRILGEVGLLGFASFFVIFVIFGIYIKKILPDVDSPLAKSFILGFVAALVGLFLNAVFIDVFEASKIAYLLWLLVGVTFGILHLYASKQIETYKELKNVLTSQYAVIFYIVIIGTVLFIPMIHNYFVGDDFTWIRWVADCNVFSKSGSCPSAIQKIFYYFTQSDGFFYRPGTKIYFLIMYSFFWLNQAVYHMVSIFLHVTAAILIYLLAKKILRSNLFSTLTAFLFLILSSYSETVFWIASTGHLFNFVFILLSLLFFATWEEKKKTIYFMLFMTSFSLSLLFHELGVVVPFIVFLYKYVSSKEFKISIIFKKNYILLFVPVVVYLLLRLFANSHWFSGDYNYNLVKLPFNIIGNATGYFLLAAFGSISLPLYQILRNILRGNILILSIITLGVLSIFVVMRKAILSVITKKTTKEDRRIVLFGILFFIATLLPFLGLGNITSRYSYLASAAFVMLFVFVLKKLYEYLQNNGRDVALASVVTILAVFSLLHIMQTQQATSDWQESGKRTEKFVIGIDSLYSDYWSIDPVELHFVNVPIKIGEAWVFPVGLKDALWITFRNPKMRVFQDSSLDQALAAIDGTPSKKVFVFDSAGNITEIKKTLTPQSSAVKK